MGIALILIFFGGVGAWLAYTPLAAAVISTGNVAVEGRRQTVQHLDGGTVTEIHVKEGQKVEQGQILFKLSDTIVAADLAAVQLQIDAQRILLARLLAEREEANRIKFPDDLTAKSAANSTLREIMDSQTKLFENRKSSYQHEVAMNRARIAQTHEQLGGVTSLRDALNKRLVLVEEENGMVRQLVKSGAAARLRLMESDKMVLDSQAQIASATAQLGQLTNVIAETELAILKLRQEFSQKVNDELRESFRLLGDLEFKRRQANDVFERTVVRAPVTGSVVGLTVFTIGQVINRGTTLMEVVPSEAQLLIEAAVRPEDVDLLRVGMEAHIRLTALKAEGQPIVRGEITRISADRVIDQQEKIAVFPIEVQFHQISGDPEKAMITKRLYPGMPVELSIPTRERSALTYIIEPLTKRFDKAFVQY